MSHSWRLVFVKQSTVRMINQLVVGHVSAEEAIYINCHRLTSQQHGSRISIHGLRSDRLDAVSSILSNTLDAETCNFTQIIIHSGTYQIHLFFYRTLISYPFIFNSYKAFVPSLTRVELDSLTPKPPWGGVGQFLF